MGYLGPNGTGFFGEELAFIFPYCHENEIKQDRIHGFYVNRMSLYESKPLRSIELPDNPNMYLFALTLVTTVS